MPELPEVETVVRLLRPKLIGKRFARVQLHRRDIVTPATADLPALLSGSLVEDIDRRAKKILIRLQTAARSPALLGFHLGMTGQLTIEPAAQEVRPHTHFAADLSGENTANPKGRKTGISGDALQLRFRDVRRFGGIWWIEGSVDPDEVRTGPEPLSLAAADLEKLLARTARAIKTALLDQRLLAGVGNIYADEALFVARIHPTTPANRLTTDDAKRLNRAIKLVLRQAIAHQGSTLRDYVTVNGESGRYQNLHRVYAREGKPCHRCRRPVVRIVLGGRSTHFCANCQT